LSLQPKVVAGISTLGCLRSDTHDTPVVLIRPVTFVYLQNIVLATSAKPEHLPNAL